MLTINVLDYSDMHDEDRSRQFSDIPRVLMARPEGNNDERLYLLREPYPCVYLYFTEPSPQQIQR